MSEKRRGLGRGLGALIPTGLDGPRSPEGQRPVDVFFPDNRKETRERAEAVERDGVPRETSVDAAPDATTRPDSQPEALAPGKTDGVTESAVVSISVMETSEIVPAEVVDGTSVEEASVSQAEGADVPRAASEGSSTGERLNGAAAATSTAAAGGSTSSGDDGLLAVPGARFAELPVTSIRPNPRQPRTVFEEDALDELVGSIREIGVLQPIVVRPDGADGYELIMGERRWRATQAAGLDVIPAIIRDTEDSDLLRDALLENLHRSELNPLEEAAAYRQLLDDFGCTHEELATRIHRSRPQISNTLRLLRLPPLVQRRVAAGVLSAGHARALLGLTDGAAIERLAQRIVSEGLSVRAVEEIVSLGGEEAPTRRKPRAGERNEALDELASRLSDRLDTRVKINLGKSRGRLTVEFASVQDLNRILESLAPEEPGFLKS
ncbi:ParB/RepB/Spo0J family partition protein [Cellulomonas chengniuliangii]|uniref:ParB/RepB/Spo0J family partition protein n=1 Tax=Cellulomonas chengniuliangii TaxID=2968084 RepID=UPI001D0F3F08|nr:ParB/RepB/Spo0J family partition protein [Cellulomonas chengniuliangii]MCC2318421.1 ParB/RepB/Spo0J family partition protein [Cellulomonas chengniuliangii]